LSEVDPDDAAILRLAPLSGVAAALLVRMHATWAPPSGTLPQWGGKRRSSLGAGGKTRLSPPKNLCRESPVVAAFCSRWYTPLPLGGV